MIATRRPFSLLLPALLALAAGCGMPQFRLEDDPEVRAITERAAPLAPFRLGVLPIEIAYATTRTAEEASADDGRSPVALDRRALRDEICDALRRFTRFRDVHPLDPDPSGAGSFATALDAHDDAVLRVRIDACHDVFRGRNVLFFPNLALRYYLLFPAWFVPEMSFGVDLDASIFFYDVRSEQPIAEERAKVETSRALNDFERSWHWLDSFRMPGCLDEASWREIGEGLNPEAIFGLERAAVLAAARSAAPALEPGAGPSTTFALLAGVPRYRSTAIPATPAAPRDVAAMAEFLARAGVPAKNVRQVLGERATREGIDDALRELAGRAAEGDTVLVYFSGAGAGGAEGDPAILGIDADPSAAAGTGFRLARAREILAKSRARRALVVLDAAFGGPSRVRGFEPAGRAEAGAAAAISSEEPFLREWAEAGPPAVSILGAASPGETAGDLEGAGIGLLTYYVVEAAGAARPDGNGVVNLEEIAAHLARYVPAQAELEGRRQHPRLYAPADRSASDARLRWTGAPESVRAPGARESGPREGLKECAAAPALVKAAGGRPE